MNILELNCYSHKDFDRLCYDNGWNDDYAPEDSAFISIIGTEDSQDKYLGEKELHWFKENHNNILNLEFDDISQGILDWNGCRFTGITKEQARECVEFIENNLGKHFYIHCRAGKSRSQGIVRFILDMYEENYKTRVDNPCISPNIYVVGELKRAYYKKHNYYETIN